MSQYFENVESRAYEKIASGDTKKSLTANTYNNSTYKLKKAVVFVEDNSIRFTVDGTTDPTTSVGAKIDKGMSFELTTRHDIKNFQFISASAGNAANLFVYYGY